MGGRGSGRYSYGVGTTNEYQRIDVRYLQRRGYLASPTWTRLNWNRNGEHCASIQISTTRQMGAGALSGLSGLDTVQLRRRARMVSVPSILLWSASSNPLLRWHLRLPALLSNRLYLPARELLGTCPN